MKSTKTVRDLPNAEATPVEPTPAQQSTASANDDVVTLSDARLRAIQEAAYYRAQSRGFTGGSEVTDWLDAEAEIDRHRLD